MSEELKQKRAKAEAFCADNLRECAAELIEWQNNTALLRDGKVRELAALCGEYVGGFDGGFDGLKVAERMIQNQACERVAASTSPARPGDVPIPTSADMAELMEKVGYSYLQTYAPERLKPTSLASGAGELPRSEQVLRRLLAYRVAGVNLYTDDGELQDNTTHPRIDFKRDSVDAIEEKMDARAALAATRPERT